MVKAAGEQLTSRPTATAPVVDSTEFQPAIFEKEDQSVPVVHRVTDCLGEGGSTGDTAKLFGEPDMHGLNQRPALLLAYAPTFFGGLAADVGLNRIERGNPPQGFFGNRRLRGDEDIVEFPSRVPLACHSTRYARGTLGSLAQQKAS
jgi:hypothetical protein